MSGLRTGKRGRPLVFLLMVVLGWTGLRLTAVSLWPEAAEPSAFASQVVAVEDPVAPTALADDITPSETPAPALEKPVTAADAVEGLEPAPPAHLEVAPLPLPEAAGHNALWMAGSLVDAGPEESLPAEKVHAELPRQN